MPHTCSISTCNSTSKSPEIRFHTFPADNVTRKYWIAATGYTNWSPYTGARICSLHFKHTDYYNIKHTKRRRLKPDVIPTQSVHANILQVLQQHTNASQMFQQYKMHKVKEDNQKDIIKNEEEFVIEDDDKKNITMSLSLTDAQNIMSSNKKELVIKDNNNETTLATLKCLKCSNHNELIRENEQLKKDIEKLKQSQEERLSQQASMFHSLMHHKETVLKKKLEIVQVKNKTLNKSIKRKQQKITNLKTLFKHLKDKNILENDATFRLSNEFGNLVPLLQNEKKNKNKSVEIPKK